MSTHMFCISGFLGAGKTTLLNRLIPGALKQGSVAVLENDFGQLGIDAALVSRPEVHVAELASGCICCTIAGSLIEALEKIVNEHAPDVLFIEPSGISRTSDLLPLLRATAARCPGLSLRHLITVVDCANFSDYVETFGTFFEDQIRQASILLFSHTAETERDEHDKVISLVSGLNKTAVCLDVDWLSMDPRLLWSIISDLPARAVEKNSPFPANVSTPVFTSWSASRLRNFSAASLEESLTALSRGRAGQVARAKGFCRDEQGRTLHFDYLPGHLSINETDRDARPGMAVIGQNLDEHVLTELFADPQSGPDAEPAGDCAAVASPV